MRYVCVTFILTLTMMSPKVKKRFPTLNHFVEAGLITPQEKELMEQFENEFPPYSKYWYVSYLLITILYVFCLCIILVYH